MPAHLPYHNMSHGSPAAALEVVELRNERFPRFWFPLEVRSTFTAAVSPTTRIETIEAYPERANLYRLTLAPIPARLYVVTRELEGRIREEVFARHRKGAVGVRPDERRMRQLVRREIGTALESGGYALGRRPQPLVIDTSENYTPDGSDLRVHPAYQWSVIGIGGIRYLCLDHRLKVQATLSLAALRQKRPAFGLLPTQRLLVLGDKGWYEARLLEIGAQSSRVTAEDGEEIEVSNGDVVPRLSRGQIAELAPALGLTARDLESRVKQLSFLIGANAALGRLEATNRFARTLSERIFPILADGLRIAIDPQPAVLGPPNFSVGHDLKEVAASFDHVDRSKRAGTIRDGLLTFGAYDRSPAPIRLLLLTTASRAQMLRRLVDRINDGSYRFKGTVSTFGSGLEVSQVIQVADISEYEEQIREFVRSPERNSVDLALVYLPRGENTADLRHPYFRTKGILLREGLPSQMVDEGTVQDPRWKDLGLGLKIYAKVGHIPWVLDDTLADADMFIGLSSSFLKQDGRIERVVGYVNIFDSYGRWRFYEGDTVAFSFKDRIAHFEELVSNSVAAYRAQHGGALNRIQFHQTKAFSVTERTALAKSVRSLIPDAELTFVHVNLDHALRLYDLHSPDGRIRRATYLLDRPGRVYLATTGANTYGQPNMGTPVPIALTAHRDPGGEDRDLRGIAQTVLSLTRLNWASSHSFCHEPITTKFAGRIAFLMNGFLQDPNFRLNASLRSTPWFL